MTSSEDKRFSRIIDEDYSDFSDENLVLCQYIKELHDKLEQQQDPVRENLGAKIAQLPPQEVISAAVVAFGVGPLVLAVLVWLLAALWTSGDVTGYYTEGYDKGGTSCTVVMVERPWWPDSQATPCLRTWQAVSYIQELERMKYDLHHHIGPRPSNVHVVQPEGQQTDSE